MSGGRGNFSFDCPEEHFFISWKELDIMILYLYAALLLNRLLFSTKMDENEKRVSELAVHGSRTVFYSQAYYRWQMRCVTQRVQSLKIFKLHSKSLA